MTDKPKADLNALFNLDNVTKPIDSEPICLGCLIEEILGYLNCQLQLNRDEPPCFIDGENVTKENEKRDTSPAQTRRAYTKIYTQRYARYKLSYGLCALL